MWVFTFESFSNMFLIFISSKTYIFNKMFFIYKYNEALIHNQVYGGYMTWNLQF